MLAGVRPRCELTREARLACMADRMRGGRVRRLGGPVCMPHAARQNAGAKVAHHSLHEGVGFKGLPGLLLLLRAPFGQAQGRAVKHAAVFDLQLHGLAGVGGQSLLQLLAAGLVVERLLLNAQHPVRGGCAGCRIGLLHQLALQQQFTRQRGNAACLAQGLRQGVPCVAQLRGHQSAGVVAWSCIFLGWGSGPWLCRRLRLGLLAHGQHQISGHGGSRHGLNGWRLRCCARGAGGGCSGRCLSGCAGQILPGRRLCSSRCSWCRR